MSAAGQPWMKFYPADWRADPALRVCSIGARGLWMEMLCLMHEAEPRGSLLIAEKQVSVAQLAALVGLSRKLVSSLLAELEQALVFSRDGDGTIFSRRIRRDVAKAERDKANGKAGGNPNLKHGVNPHDKAQKPEARGQKPERRDQSASREGARSVFEREFWPLYPHKVGKPAAIKAFEKLWRETGGDLTPVMAGLDRYIRLKPADRAWMNPATFLNQRRFEDQPANGMFSPDTPLRSSSIDFGGGVVWPESTVLMVLDKWRTDPRTWPADRIGPPPGEPGCQVPEALLQRAG